MKGFTKGKGKGRKFIPTTNKKHGLKKSDIAYKKTVDNSNIENMSIRKLSDAEWLEKIEDQQMELKIYGDNIYEHIDGAGYGEIIWYNVDDRLFEDKNFDPETGKVMDEMIRLEKLKLPLMKKLKVYPHNDDGYDPKHAKEISELFDIQTMDYDNDKVNVIVTDIQNSGVFNANKADDLQQYLISEKGSYDLEYSYNKDEVEAVRKAVHKGIEKFTMGDYDSNQTLQDGGDIRNALALAKEYGTKKEVDDMESMLRSYESTGNTYNFEYDEMNKIDSKYFRQFDLDSMK